LNPLGTTHQHDLEMSTNTLQHNSVRVTFNQSEVKFYDSIAFNRQSIDIHEVFTDKH